MLEKSLDRGKHKQTKTSGDCSQQLCSGTMSQTAAVTLQGRYLWGHCLPGGTQRGKEPPIPTSCWKMRAVVRGSGSTKQPSQVLGRERTPTPGCSYNQSHQRDMTHPQIHMPFPDTVSARKESPNHCYHIPRATLGLVGCHIAPRACCWQGRDGRMEQGILTPRQKPISAYQSIMWCGKYGVS